MTYKELQQRSIDIDLLEKDLMRDLTKEEKDLVADKGFKALLERLHITISDLSLIKQIREIFGAFFSEEIEKYESLVNKPNNEKVIETLEDILQDLKKEQKSDYNINNIQQFKIKPVCNSQDMIDVYISQLKDGEILELEPDVLDQVIDRLWNKENNIKIEVRNNKIRLR